jgi:transcriptional regulator with XRE-family HTH domain
MGRSLNEVINALPPEEQARIDTRYQELKQEVEGLRELRQLAGKAQADIASALNIKQPSVSKIEKQADMYLSTLRNYVEAIGGQLELTVKLPARPALRLQSLGDVATTADASSTPIVALRHKAATSQPLCETVRASLGRHVCGE